MQRNVAVSTYLRLISTGTDPITIKDPHPRLKHAQTNTDSFTYNNSENNIEDHTYSSDSFLQSQTEVRKRVFTNNFGVQVGTPLICKKKNASVQVKPLYSNVFVHTELLLTDSITQTPKIMKKDVGVGVNVVSQSILKCHVGSNTDKDNNLKFASKFSDTLDLVKTVNVSVNTTKKKRVDASVETCELLNYPHDKVELKKNKKDVEKKKKTLPVFK